LVSGPTAVERLQALPSEAPPLELYPAWNAQVNARPEPFQGALAVLEGFIGEGHPGEAAAAESALAPWLYLLGGLLLGVLGMFALRRLSGRTGPDVQAAAPRMTGAPGGKDIQLISSQVLTDQGSVLVVDVCGERLVLGVSGNRDFVTLLTKLGEQGAAPPALDAGTLGTMLTGSRPAASSERRPAPERSSVYTPTPSTPPGEAPPDEDLEVLLDELLGKVRGLKPLAKRADET
jgi:flagellar biogenesis protein FliO